jgi:hypothetical protein
LFVSSLVPKFGSEKGGIVVSIIGSNFIDSEALVCRFGNKDPVKAVFLSSGNVKCVAPKNPPGKVSVVVSNNGFDYVENSDAIFTFLPGARVSSFFPKIGSMKGGTTIAVYGTGFSTEGTKCHFGKQLVTAVVQSNTYLECESPSSTLYMSNETLVMFAVTNAAENVSEVYSSLTFTYQPAMVVHQAIPSLIPTFGRKYIELEGTAFRLEANISCIYSNDDDTLFGKVVAHVLSSEKMKCMLPDISNVTTTVLFVKLSVNGILQADCGARLTLYKPVEIIDFNPTLGVTTGGTVVSIFTASNTYPSSANVVCSFGNNGTVFALKFTGSKIVCKSPAHLVSDVILGVSINNYDFQYATIPYSYVVEDSISYIEPSSGSSNGGTTLSIYGTGFLNKSSLSCRIGDTIVGAVYMSTTTIYCTTPFFSTTVSKEVSVSISNNGQDWTDSTLTFQYLPLITLAKIVPSHGPLEGQTILRILASGISVSDVGKLSCKFGNETVVATVISLGEIKCVTPSSKLERTVPVSILRNGEEITRQRLKFKYREIHSLLKVTPNHATEVGKISVALIFQDMPQNMRDLWCHFGDVKVEASVLTPISIKCIVPPLSPGEHALSLSVNGVHYLEHVVPFYINPAIKLLSLGPKSGPINGGTVIAIEGTGFLLHETSYCRFGKVIVVGFVKSTTKIQCTSPPQISVGIVDVEVSMGDNVAFFVSPLQFNYQENVIISSISPRIGPVSGSSLIIIEGKGFVNSKLLACEFGRVDPIVTPGKFINVNKISCLSPPNEVGPIKLEVSVNGIDFSDSGQRFEYIKNLLI